MSRQGKCEWLTQPTLGDCVKGNIFSWVSMETMSRSRENDMGKGSCKDWEGAHENGVGTLEGNMGQAFSFLTACWDHMMPGTGLENKPLAATAFRFLEIILQLHFYNSSFPIRSQICQLAFPRERDTGLQHWLAVTDEDSHPGASGSWSREASLLTWTFSLHPGTGLIIYCFPLCVWVCVVWCFFLLRLLRDTVQTLVVWWHMCL